MWGTLRTNVVWGLLQVVVTVCCTLPGLAVAAPAPLTWSTEPAAVDVKVGEVFVLRLRGTVPATAVVNAAEVAAAVTMFSVGGARDQSLTVGEHKLVDVHLLVRADRRGFYALPTPTLTLRDAAGTPVGKVAVAPEFLAIPRDAARPELLRPDRPLQPVPWRVHHAWWWAAATVVLVGLGAVWWWRYRGRAVTVIVDPDAAFAAEVAALGDPQQPLDRDRAFALSHAVRGYIERVTGVPALEQTEAELRAALEQTHHLHDRDLWLMLAAEVAALELVKFAPGSGGREPLAARLRPVLTAVNELKVRRAARSAAAKAATRAEADAKTEAQA